MTWVRFDLNLGQNFFSTGILSTAESLYFHTIQMYGLIFLSLSNRCCSTASVAVPREGSFNFCFASVQARLVAWTEATQELQNRANHKSKQFYEEPHLNNRPMQSNHSVSQTRHFVQWGGNTIGLTKVFYVALPLSVDGKGFYEPNWKSEVQKRHDSI